MSTGCATIKTVRYSIDSSKLAPSSNVTIALIADLHSTLFGTAQEPLIEKLTEAKPDLIVLCGDIFDEYRPFDAVEFFLEGIQNIAPIYFVYGNHEYYNEIDKTYGSLNDIKNLLLRYKVRILDDAFETITVRGSAFILAGVQDPAKTRYEMPGYGQERAMQTAFTKLREMPGYKILLAHRPERIKYYAKYPFDLVLSGHAHGGQVRLLFINGLYAPGQGIFPKYAGGLYKYENAALIVSRGISVHEWRPRVFNSPELVIVTLNGSDKK